MTILAPYLRHPAHPAAVKTVVLRQEDAWTTHDPYDFWEQSRSDQPPEIGAEEHGGLSQASIKALEIEQNWEKMLKD